ncbi:MAG: hypothetical protein R3B67_10460 [Phycisphaerales bacterium]
MKIERYLRRGEVRGALIILLVLVLLAAAVNVPFAITKIRSRTGTFPTRSVDLDGPEAAAKGWPARTPHNRVWDEPDSWTMWSGFGIREYDVRSPSRNPGENGFSMSVQFLGWPTAVIEIKQMWWNWGDPSLNGPESDPRPQLVPLGLVLNPVLVGGGAWVLLGLLPLAVRVTRRVVRIRRGRCPWCGFDASGLEVCPECGRVFVAC